MLRIPAQLSDGRTVELTLDDAAVATLRRVSHDAPMRPAEAAQFLGVSLRTLRDYIGRGLPKAQPAGQGGAILIHPASATQWLQDHREFVKRRRRRRLGGGR